MPFLNEQDYLYFEDIPPSRSCSEEEDEDDDDVPFIEY